MSTFTTQNDRLCTAVVTTWRRPELLAATLDSLLAQSYPHLEIVVVCDGADADVLALSETFPSNRPLRWIFHPENLGLAAARNTGAREGRGEIVLFLDDDIVADAELVSTHMKHHSAVGDLRRIVVCGRIEEDPGRKFSTYIDECLNESRNQIFDASTTALMAPGQEAVGDDIERGLWCGLNCSLSRELLLENGAFNQHFRSAEEEMELGERLHGLGFEFIYEPHARLLHKNTKEWSSYYRNAWRARGAVDPYRVFELHQRNAQTQRLAAPCHGFVWERAIARLAWGFATPIERMTELVERLANRTRLHSLFGAWARMTRSSAYWGEVRNSGCDLEALCEAAGRDSTALMLHSICKPQNPQESSYYLSPERFRQFFYQLRKSGYKTVTADRWIAGQVPPKHVLLTFDDGYDDLYTEMFPFFAQLGFTALVFLVAGQIGASNIWDQKNGLRARNLLNLDQIREMQKYGIAFGSHTMTHPHLPDVSDADLIREVRESKHRLEDLLGVEISSFAYPYGGVDRRVRSAVVDAGYKQAFTILPGSNWWNDPFTQRRAEVNDYTSMLDFHWKVSTGLGLTASIGVRFRSLQRCLPTSFLRGIAGGVGNMGHRVAQSLSREARERGRIQD